MPDFPKIVARDGAWLATKFARFLSELSVVPRVLVCPDEAGARILADLLQSLYAKSDIVQIPRSLLKAQHADAVRVDDDRELRQQLEFARNATVVVVDDFTRSDTTLRAIQTILRPLGITVSFSEKYSIFLY